VINGESVKSIYAGAAGIRNIVLLLGTIVTISIAWADNKSDTKIANEKAEKALKENTKSDKVISKIGKDVAILKDDQDEMQIKVENLSRESMRQTILLERIATRMQINTETE